MIDWEDRTTAVLFGDGAGGVLLESSEQQTFLAESLYTDGSRGEVLQSSLLAYLLHIQTRKWIINTYLWMVGLFFDFAIRDVAKSIQKLVSYCSSSS